MDVSIGILIDLTVFMKSMARLDEFVEEYY